MKDVFLCVSRKESTPERRLLLEERVAIIGIFIHNPEAAVKANEVLHAYADVIVGRMGIPYREKSINIISVIVNASANEISSLAGKLGRIDGITVKSMQTDPNS